MGQIEGISVETLMLAKKYTDEHGGGGGGATDAGSVSYDETKTYKEGTVGAELTAQKNAISQKADKTVATTTADGLMSASDKTKLDDVYADYSSALTALGVI